MYEEIIYEYEMILIGKKNSFSGYFFNDTAEKNERKALHVIDFAIKTYLGWTPQEAILNLNWEILKSLKLDLLTKYIMFPPEMDERDDMYIVTGKLYPKLVKLDAQEITLKVYKRVLEKDLYKFPKEYLSGDQQGRNRAIICFQYMLAQFTNFKNIQEMYEFFSTSGGPKLLKKYRLNVACVSTYEHPIDFLHAALPENVRSEFWYRYYRFRISNNEQIREMKKDKTFIY